MLNVVLPRRPVPAALEEAVRVARAARDQLLNDLTSPAKAREAAEQEYERAVTAVQQHYVEVGTEKVIVPREIEAEGPAAIEGFIASQVERLSAEAEPKAPKRRAKEG